MVQGRWRQRQARFWWIPWLVILAWSHFAKQQAGEGLGQSTMAGKGGGQAGSAEEGCLSTLRCPSQGGKTKHDRGSDFQQQRWLRERPATCGEHRAESRTQGQAARWREDSKGPTMEGLRGRAEAMLRCREAGGFVEHFNAWRRRRPKLS